MGIQINGATDSITAIDGTIDVVSAIGNAGVVTATAFVGNITGNVTGNINHTSNLELQTGGVTRASITSSGAVMINTTNSSSRTLNLKGTFGILSSSQTGVLDMSVTDGGEASIGPYVAGGSSLIFKTNSSGAGVAERLRITPRGYREIRNYH